MLSSFRLQAAKSIIERGSSLWKWHKSSFSTTSYMDLNKFLLINKQSDTIFPSDSVILYNPSFGTYYTVRLLN